MSVYVVSQARIEDRDRLGEYVAKALPTIQKCGGRVLAYDEAPAAIEGEIANPRTVILEFESREAFEAWYRSADYQAILPIRLAAAPGSLIVVEGIPSS